MAACSDPAEICTTGVDSILLTGIFVRLLRVKFSSADNIEAPSLKGAVWVPNPTDPVWMDESQSKILIESVTRWDPNSTQQRPALLVKRKGWQDQRLGVGVNRLQQIGIPEADKMREWATDYVSWISGSHVIYAVDKSPGTAEVLASEVEQHLRQFASVFLNEFSWTDFHVPSMGELSKLEESSEHWAVPITVQYAFWDCWRIIPEQPLFTGLSMNLDPSDC